MNKIVDQYSDLPSYGARHYHRNKTKCANNFKSYKAVLKLERPAAYLLWRVKGRAKERGLEFSITENDLFVPDVCPILGIKLAFGDGKVIDSTPSVDRIDNNLGYIKGNVRVISHKANKLKSDLTREQLVALLKYVDGEVKIGRSWADTH